MIIKKIIDKKPDVFNELCRNHQVKRLYAFGSSVSQKFDEAKSDIDLVVDLKESIDSSKVLIYEGKI